MLRLSLLCLLFVTFNMALVDHACVASGEKKEHPPLRQQRQSSLKKMTQSALIADAVSPVERKRTDALRQLVDQQREGIRRLIKVVNEPLANGEPFYINTARRNVAMQLLGEYQATEAVPSLIRWIVPGENHNFRMTNIGYRGGAVHALERIGRAAVPALLERIKVTGSQPRKKLTPKQNEGIAAAERDVCLQMLFNILESVDETNDLLRHAIEKTKDRKQKANLQAVLDRFNDQKHQQWLLNYLGRIRQ